MTNILFIWDRLGDYHWARIASLKDTSGINVYSAALGATDKLYHWEDKVQKNHFTLSSRAVESTDLIRMMRFLTIIKQQQISIVFVPGWSKKEYLFFSIIAKLHSIKVYAFVESWYPSHPYTMRIKSMFVRMLFTGFFASGKRARFFLTTQLNIPANKVQPGYSIVDNQHFYVPPVERAWRDTFTILCVARFIPEKNILSLIESFFASFLFRQKTKLIVLGGGDLLPVFMQWQERSGGKIQIHPWVGYQEITTYYKRAHLFVLPSIFEPWGLVVNEAMSAALPCLVSIRCGCAADLVIDHKTGYLFDPDHPNSLEAFFNSIADGSLSKENLYTTGVEAQKHVFNQFGLHRWKNSLLKLIRNA